MTTACVDLVSEFLVPGAILVHPDALKQPYVEVGLVGDVYVLRDRETVRIIISESPFRFEDTDPVTDSNLAPIGLAVLVQDLVEHEDCPGPAGKQRVQSSLTALVPYERCQLGEVDRENHIVTHRITHIHQILSGEWYCLQSRNNVHL